MGLYPVVRYIFMILTLLHFQLVLTCDSNVHIEIRLFCPALIKSFFFHTTKKHQMTKKIEEEE